jgi:radical SAM protein with 4Fe4S-binding SPASM domain
LKTTIFSIHISKYYFSFNTQIMTDPSIIRYGGFHPDYKQEREYFEKNMVYSIQIEVTTACSQGCHYCYASDPKTPIQHMTDEEVHTIIDTAAKLDVKAIDWLGGDPLLHPNWYSLMQTAQKQGLTNNIWTSGLLLANKTYAQKSVNVTQNGFISVHLDTLNETLYHHLHHGDAHHNITTILKGIDLVQKYGKNPNQMLNCITLTKLVATDVEKTIDYFYYQKGMRTCLTQLCPTGLATAHPEWMPTQDQIKHAYTTRDTINYPDSKASMGTMDTNKYYCGGIICITINGEVTPCSVIRQGVGNIHQQPLEHIIQQHRDTLLFSHLRIHKTSLENCENCENSSVCWGCRAAAYYDTGDSCGKDPKCYKYK